MAKKEDRKKQKQRDKERKKAAAQAKYLAQKAKAERYPEIVFETSQGNGYFVAAVRAAVEGLDFDSPEMGPDWMREFYCLGRKEGFTSAIRHVHERQERNTLRRQLSSASPASSHKHPNVNYIPLHLGERVMERIDIDIRRRFLPMNDFLVLFRDCRITFRFTSLFEEPSDWGTVFYSRLLPKVEIDGKRATVAFSTHAIEQLCSRRSPRYLTFGGCGDAHAYLARCIYHEVLTLTDGSPAIRLWDDCDGEGFRVYHHYVNGVFGGEANRKVYGGKLHYVLGYCPIVLENGFAKAKSFLYPGFRGTPERTLLKTTNEHQSRYAEWLDAADDKQAEPFYETPRAIEVAKWFHNNGVPQVAQMTHEVIQSGI
jgi:hypothetical protein